VSLRNPRRPAFEEEFVIELDRLVQNRKINAIEILSLANRPLLTLKFSHPDGTPVMGKLNYAMSTSQLSLGGQLPLVNGQATCVLGCFSSGARSRRPDTYRPQSHRFHRQHGVANLHWRESGGR
jgi:hypothetical protein